MFTRPTDLSVATVAEVVSRTWSIDVDGIQYAPVGFGSHHWIVVTADGSEGPDRWFVTVDDVGPAGRFERAQLAAALGTARVLRDHGLDFVVAPRQRPDGDVLAGIDDRWVVSVFPHVAGTSRGWGRFDDPAAREAVLDRLVAVHAMPTATVPARTEDFALQDRDHLDHALADIDHTEPVHRLGRSPGATRPDDVQGAPGAERSPGGSRSDDAGDAHGTETSPGASRPDDDGNVHGTERRPGASHSDETGDVHGTEAAPGASRREEADATVGSWDAGPFGPRASDLLRRHCDRLVQRVGDHDRFATRAADDRSRFVVTHGEPHRGNTVESAADGLVLVDWDTTLLAPPERDLWWLTKEDSDVVAAYRDRTGVALDPSLLALYEERWALPDLAAAVAEFRRPHVDSEDTRTSWAALRGVLAAIPPDTAGGADGIGPGV